MRIPIISFMLLAYATGVMAQDKVTIGIGEITFQVRRSESEKNRRAYTGRESDEDTRAFQDMLSTALIKTRKFDVIERARLEELLKEQALSSYAGLVEGGAEIGSIQGVDYLIYGAITQFGVEEKNLGFGGRFSTTNKKAYMTVDIKIIEAETGKAIIAETVTEEAVIGSGLNAGGLSQNSEEPDPLGNVMRSSANSVIGVIVSAIFPVKVIAVQPSGTIVINYGSGFVEPYSVFDIFSQGETFTDPDTGEVLGAEEEKVGRIEITSVQAKFSKGTLIEGNLDSIEKGAICRPVSAAIIKAEGKSKKKRKKLIF